MVAEAEIICDQTTTLSVSIRPDLFDLATPSKPVLDICASDSVAVELTRSESVCFRLFSGIFGLLLCVFCVD